MSVNGEIPIGPRLRMARQQGGLSIGQVAAATGLTKGFISQVERDLTSASVAALVRLCDALHISVASLFEPTSANLVRYDSRSRINFGGDNVTEWLLTPTTERRIRVIESRIAPGGGSGPEAYVLGAEAEWAHVVQGDARDPRRRSGSPAADRRLADVLGPRAALVAQPVEVRADNRSLGALPGRILRRALARSVCSW